MKARRQASEANDLSAPASGRRREEPQTAFQRSERLLASRAAVQGSKARDSVWGSSLHEPEQGSSLRPVPKRFTLDGSPELEAHLAQICDRVLIEVKKLIPGPKLEAVILGGGYGRGQGGVLKTDRGDAPYNDLEFYVFMRGSRLLNERVFRTRLETLGEQLSPRAGLHVEFKIDSLPRFRRSPVSMFSYDLVSGHHILYAATGGLTGCVHHLDFTRIPLHEATRLLMNRCTGLLLARERLDREPFTGDDGDFVGRNLAKLHLGLGDAVLTAFGCYHWNCVTRHERLRELLAAQPVPHATALERHHAHGVEFKLHPHRVEKEAEAFGDELAGTSELARELWLWLESRRLGSAFHTVQQYAFSTKPKCSEVPVWRSAFVSARLFGARVFAEMAAFRYPRERLLNALPLLLWDDVHDPEVRQHLQKQLRTEGSDWQSFVAAYKRIWPSLS